MKDNQFILPKSQLIYGRHPIMEALEAGQHFDKILLQKNITHQFTKKLLQITQARQIPTQLVPIEKLNRITRKNHQGIIGFAALLPYYKVEDVLAQTYEQGKTPLFLLCDGITDVRNFGAIVRTAVCTGVQAIVITQKGSVAITADTIKASAGALYKINICKVPYLDNAITYLKDSGLQIVASALASEAKIPKNIDFTSPTAILLGSEGKGISPKHLKMADHTAQIPIIGDFDSYNVSVAAAIFLYESLRQRT